MPLITLPDGTELTYEAPLTALEVAGDIGSRLAQQALGCKVDGVLSDLSTELAEDCSLSIVTPNDREGDPDPDARYLLRHSCAHVMAEAIQRVFEPV